MYVQVSEGELTQAYTDFDYSASRIKNLICAVTYELKNTVVATPISSFSSVDSTSNLIKAETSDVNDAGTYTVYLRA
jgi:hypothetical protein